MVDDDDDDGRMPDHGHPISSPCEPNGSGELKIQNCAYHVRSKNQQYANNFRFYEYSDKIPFKLSQNDNFSTSFVCLLCQQSKSSYNIYVAFDRSILHIIHVSSVVIP